MLFIRKNIDPKIIHFEFIQADKLFQPGNSHLNKQTPGGITWDFVRISVDYTRNYGIPSRSLTTSLEVQATRK